MLITAKRLIDGDASAVIADAAVRVEGSQVTYAGPAADLPPGNDDEVIDLGDVTVMPGLIDCHAHPVPFPRTADAARTPWGEHYAVLQAVDSLTAALRSGVTTIRDCGAPHQTAFGVRQALEDGVVPGPRLVIAGPPICPTGGHGHYGGGEADGPDGVRTKVRSLFKSGVSFIKVTATGGGTPGTLRNQPTFEAEEMRAAAREAEVRESYVTAHCHATEGIRRCIEAGVQMLEHATFVDPDGVERYDKDIGLRIRDAGIIVDPTVEIHSRWVQDAEAREGELSEEDRALLARRKDGLGRRLNVVHELLELGVPIIVGSDAGLGRNYPAVFDDLGHEIALHIECGASPLQAIYGATSRAADAIGVGDHTGRLRSGYEADLIAVPGDPVTDIETLNRPVLVMKAGEIVVDDRQE